MHLLFQNLKKYIDPIILISCFSNLGIILITFNIITNTAEHFSYLAESFISGVTYFLKMPAMSWGDTTLFNNHYYWPLGPFPAVLLIPFVWIFKQFNVFFHQGYLQLPIVIGIGYLFFAVAKRLKINNRDSLYATLAFISSSFFMLAIQPSGWIFSQIIVIFFIFLALLEYLTRKRYLIIGFLMGCVLATRITAGLGILFFVLDIIFSQESKKIKYQNLINLAAPFMIIIILLGFYNYLRFENFLDSGYKHQILTNPALIKARDYGLFSIHHLASNLYYFLLAGPIPVFKDSISRVLAFPFIKPDPWGMSIFITSPYLLYMFCLKYKDGLSKIILITATIIALPIFLYYGIGWIQFGYRYAFDFLPFIFLLFIKNYNDRYHNFSKLLKIIIVFSLFFNLFLIFTGFLK
ncbi:MAG: hypothetical protein QMD65_00225 [Patescibacteria group bacterium]|nr:hypothetical protein [Patescibacteria group bacterium]